MNIMKPNTTTLPSPSGPIFHCTCSPRCPTHSKPASSFVVPTILRRSRQALIILAFLIPMGSHHLSANQIVTFSYPTIGLAYLLSSVLSGPSTLSRSAPAARAAPSRSGWTFRKRWPSSTLHKWRAGLLTLPLGIFLMGSSSLFRDVHPSMKPSPFPFSAVPPIQHGDDFQSHYQLEQQQKHLEEQWQREQTLAYTHYRLLLLIQATLGLMVALESLVTLWWTMVVLVEDRHGPLPSPVSQNEIELMDNQHRHNLYNSNDGLNHV